MAAVVNFEPKLSGADFPDTPIWLDRYLNEYLTLEQTASLIGDITREGVRQRLKALGLTPRSSAETARLRELRDVNSKANAIRETFFETRSVSATASHIGLAVSAIERYLSREVPDWKVLTRLPQNAVKKYARDDLLSSLRDASSEPSTPLTTKAYTNFLSENPSLTDGRRRPGVQAMILRFGSWHAAVTAAGIVANPHGGPDKGFDSSDSLAAVVECWRELGVPPTAAAYEAWQVGRTGRPSGATARKHFDSWISLQVRSWQVVHGILLNQDDEDVVVPPSVTGGQGSESAMYVDYVRADEGATVSLPEAYEIGEYNALERAVQSHARIQNEVASAAQAIGLRVVSPTPRSPAFDIALIDDDHSLFVVEVKSATRENLELQLRLGLGQVLRYAHAMRQVGSRVSALVAVEVEPDQEWIQLFESLNVGLLLAGRVESDLRYATAPPHDAGVVRGSLSGSV